MNKNLLIKYIKGEASQLEREQVIAWIDKSKENENYYLELFNTIVAEDVTSEHTSVALSDEELRESYSAIQKRTAKDIFTNYGGAKKMNWLVWFSACAAILLFASVSLNIVQYFTDNNLSGMLAENQEVAIANHNQTYYTEHGVKGKIMLPDSSVVWLNSGSSITYPQYFAQDVRRVEFSGEGYFEVVRNEKCPMEVITPKGMKVTVLGTKFHICSYNDDSEEQATLFSGKINVSRIANNKEVFKVRELKPQESLKFSDVGKAFITVKADTTKKIAWKRGELIFERTPMPEVIKKLERWHGVNITVKDDEILKYHFTAEFGSASMVQILELLRFTSPIDFTVNNNEVILFSRK